MFTIVPQSEAYVVERLGRYSRTLGPRIEVGLTIPGAGSTPHSHSGATIGLVSGECDYEGQRGS